MFLWKNKQNYPLIITKYPLFHWALCRLWFFVCAATLQYSIYYVCEQWGLWRDCVDAQACLTHCCLPTCQVFWARSNMKYWSCFKDDTGLRDSKFKESIKSFLSDKWAYSFGNSCSLCLFKILLKTIKEPCKVNWTSSWDYGTYHIGN